MKWRQKSIDLEILKFGNSVSFDQNECNDFFYELNGSNEFVNQN